MVDEGYNGYTNYETWLLCLNIDNDEGVYDEVRNIALGYKDQEDFYNIGLLIKDYLEETFYIETAGCYKIYDSWTERDWKEIDWNEVAETRLAE